MNSQRIVDKQAVTDNYSFTDQHFQYIRELVNQKSGIDLSDQKSDLVYSRITRRLRALNLSNFDEYIDILKKNSENELEQFINAITTNLTAFFREKYHFDSLENDILPEFKSKGKLKGLRIWSAGCSTGEEAYSIAMVLRENIPDIDTMNIKIFASDIDSNVIQTAENGVYKENKLQGLSSERMKKWLLKGTGANSGCVKVRPELKSLISFEKMNLIQAWDMRQSFDIVFCRNVVIYFSKDTQKQLFRKFSDQITTDGYMIIGHSENLGRISTDFKLIGKTIYRKVSS